MGDRTPCPWKLAEEAEAKRDEALARVRELEDVIEYAVEHLDDWKMKTRDSDHADEAWFAASAARDALRAALADGTRKDPPPPEGDEGP